jgi:hypothetical protein
VNWSNKTKLAYQRSIATALDMEEAGHYGAAYHAATTALHCAEDAEDLDRLAEVAGILRQLRRSVDAIQPPHRLSTRRAHTGRSIFETGAAEAEAAIARIAAQRVTVGFRERMRRWPARVAG